ncbi:MAG TPA: hypothetical protein VFQ99_05765 [Gallionella sp.]|nr:hypothetical protein [Gallionella sp.]
MLDEIYTFAFGLICGLVIGAWWAWQGWLKKEKPVLHITVDRDVLSTISDQIIMDWLNQRGLTWQPKGAVFELGKPSPACGRGRSSAEGEGK